MHPRVVTRDRSARPKDPAAERQARVWRQSGAIVVWRYAPNLHDASGWHLTADATGRASLAALLDAFAADGMEDSRTLAVSPPVQAVLSMPNNRSAMLIVPRWLRVSFTPRLMHWSFPASGDVADLSLGRLWLRRLRQTVAHCSSEEDGCAIGPTGGDTLRLWSWPGAA